MAIQYTGAGTIVKMSKVGDSIGTPIELVGVSTVPLPDQSYNGIELDYLADDLGVRQTKKGDINGGQLVINFNPKAGQEATITAIKAAYLDAVNDYKFELTLKNGATYTYEGAVMSMTKGEMSKSGFMTYAVTVNVNTLEESTEASS